jgi:hypothetical protein
MSILEAFSNIPLHADCKLEDKPLKSPAYAEQASTSTTEIVYNTAAQRAAEAAHAAAPAW